MVNVHKVLSDTDLLVPKLKVIVSWISADLDYLKIPIFVFETGRVIERQKYLKSKGWSTTLKSKHLIWPHYNKLSRAVDFVVKINNRWSWNYKKHKVYYDKLGELYKIYGLIWGGDWKSFKDYPHGQLPK